MTIPKLEDYPKIIEAANNGDLVLFIGNGVSRLLGYPSWEEMANNALKMLYDEKNKKEIKYLEYELIKKLPPKKRLSIIHDICESKKIELNYKNIIKPDDNLKYKKVYDYLYSINAPFVTTNYDDCLDKLAEKSIKTGNVPIPDSTFIKDRKKVYYDVNALTTGKLDIGSVLHIHGSIKDQKNMIITTRQYISIYSRETIIDRFLEELFIEKVILIIGYSLEEDEIIEYILGRCSKIITKNEKLEAKHFWLYPRTSSEEAIFEHLKKYYINHCNVNLIDYIIDNKGHSILEEIIIEWAKQLNVKKPNFEREKEIIREILQ